MQVLTEHCRALQSTVARMWRESMCVSCMPDRLLQVWRLGLHAISWVAKMGKIRIVVAASFTTVVASAADPQLRTRSVADGHYTTVFFHLCIPLHQLCNQSWPWFFVTGITTACVCICIHAIRCQPVVTTHGHAIFCQNRL
jgi:hypothetical protein